MYSLFVTIPAQGLVIQAPSGQGAVHSPGQVFELVRAADEHGLLEVSADSAGYVLFKFLTRVQLGVYRTNGLELRMVHTAHIHTYIQTYKQIYSYNLLQNIFLKKDSYFAKMSIYTFAAPVCSSTAHCFAISSSKGRLSSSCWHCDIMYTNPLIKC